MSKYTIKRKFIHTETLIVDVAEVEIALNELKSMYENNKDWLNPVQLELARKTLEIWEKEGLEAAFTFTTNIRSQQQHKKYVEREVAGDDETCTTRISPLEIQVIPHNKGE